MKKTTHRRNCMKMLILAGSIGLSLLSSTLWAEAPGPGEGRAEATAERPAPQIATFSIVARDPKTGDYGVAVQSRYFAVGDIVPHAAANTGAIATQARGNLLYGIQGLEMLGDGLAADDVIRRLIEDDPLRDERQVGIIDRAGKPASYTGDKCLSWAGGRTGANYAAQGNLLAGPQVVDAIATAFESAPGDFATRLVYALAAGQAAGGDARGRQSAALLVVRDKAGYLGLTDRLIDLHVEDHPTPIRELARLLKIRQAQMASEQAKALIAKASKASGHQQARLLAQAQELQIDALRKHSSDDYGWWSLARIQLSRGNAAQAALSAQRALLENPAWRHLSASNREALGVSDELLDALLQVDTFRRVWNSLAPEHAGAME
jgi:uncharacterized Ntn-hydrolase superfamily protein